MHKNGVSNTVKFILKTQFLLTTTLLGANSMTLGTPFLTEEFEGRQKIEFLQEALNAGREGKESPKTSEELLEKASAIVTKKIQLKESGLDGVVDWIKHSYAAIDAQRDALSFIKESIQGFGGVYGKLAYKYKRIEDSTEKVSLQSNFSFGSKVEMSFQYQFIMALEIQMIGFQLPAIKTSTRRKVRHLRNQQLLYEKNFRNKIIPELKTFALNQRYSSSEEAYRCIARISEVFFLINVLDCALEKFIDLSYDYHFNKYSCHENDNSDSIDWGYFDPLNDKLNLYNQLTNIKENFSANTRNWSNERWLNIEEALIEWVRNIDRYKNIITRLSNNF